MSTNYNNKFLFRQTVFNRVTEAMHFMSHALHALSDGIINYNQVSLFILEIRPGLVQVLWLGLTLCAFILWKNIFLKFTNIP